MNNQNELPEELYGGEPYEAPAPDLSSVEKLIVYAEQLAGIRNRNIDDFNTLIENHYKKQQGE